MTDDLRARLAVHPLLDQLTLRQLDAIIEVVHAPVIKGEARDPEPGQVWREKARRYNKRTVVVVDEVDGTYANRPDRFIRVRTLTDYEGKPVIRQTFTKVRVGNWHKAYVFDHADWWADRG